jgi:hypothetical protein
MRVKTSGARKSLSLVGLLLGCNSAAAQYQCSVTVGNTNDRCADLLRRVPLGTKDCDCYSFCNDDLIQCSSFQEAKPFQCVGNLVAGCRHEQFDLLPTDTDQQSCAVTVNAQDQVCGTLLLENKTQDCNCHNFCNGKRIGCWAFGERDTFSCSGDIVAGCLEAQRPFGSVSSAMSLQTLMTALILMIGTAMAIVA